MVRAIALILVAFVFVSSANAQTYSGPGTLDPIENRKTFEIYCKGDVDKAETPKVNYDNPDLLSAARKLSQVEYNAFYFYSGPSQAYGLKKKSYNLYLDAVQAVFTWVEDGATIPADVQAKIDSGSLVLVSSQKKSLWYDPRPNSKPSDVSDTAHVFLVQLCGEFRDRASLIAEKVKWMNRIIKLPVTNTVSFDPKKDLWSQFSAGSYAPFIKATNQVWTFKKLIQQLNDAHSAEDTPFYFDESDLLGLNSGALLNIGSETADSYVPGLTVCETKFVFNDYVAYPSAGVKLNWSTDDQAKAVVNEYAKKYRAFAKNFCSEEDLNYYYDYRGDSNIKHYSPESNAMIWHASSVTSGCQNTTTGKADSSGVKKVSDEECRSYFSAPFSSRWNAARAGFGTWLFYSEEKESGFRNSASPVIISSVDESGARISPSNKPYAYAFDMTSTPFDFVSAFSKVWRAVQGAWAQKDAGFYEYTSFGTTSAEAERYFVFNRLRNAVNRHTNWYQSGFRDGRGMDRNQAYSPFVASSYEPSKSDAFVAPGYTVAGDRDGRKYLMYVFRVPVNSLVTSNSIKDGKAFDIERAWFDETSLGDDYLADNERAYDRLGTPLEGEFDAVLYLHNIRHQPAMVEDDHGAPIVVSK